MANVAVKSEAISKGVIQSTWEGFTANGDLGLPISDVYNSDKTVHVKGNFGTGGNIKFQGSPDKATWATLHDPQGNVLDFTSEGTEAILENPRYIRAILDAGTGGIDLDAIIVSRGGR